MKGQEDMERMISKLTSAFVVLMLLAAAVTMANSQEQPKASAIIYGIDSEGTLKWYRHDGAETGAAALQGANNVDFGKRDAARDKVYEDSLKAGAEPTSNEIRCRGYSGTGGSQYVFFTINSRPSPTGETIITYEMAFTPSMKAAGSRGEGLRPGECAFVDRPISERGPYRIRFETVANAQLKQQLHGTPLDTSPTAAERFPDTQTISAYLKDPNHYWSFFGAKPGGSFFVATGNRFWKPGIELGRPDDSIRDKDDRHVLTPKKPQ
jgi:hypothetical protein